MPTPSGMYLEPTPIYNPQTFEIIAQDSPIIGIYVDTPPACLSDCNENPPHPVARQASVVAPKLGDDTVEFPVAPYKPNLRIRLSVLGRDDLIPPLSTHSPHHVFFPQIFPKTWDPRLQQFIPILNSRETRFFQQIHTALTTGLSSVVHMQRGTYKIQNIDDPGTAALLKWEAVAQCIAEYISDYGNGEQLVNVCSTPVAVFKPADEVRGGPNARVMDPNKTFSDCEIEIMGELVAAGLFPLNQMVVGWSVTHSRFYDSKLSSTDLKTKNGVAISYLPMTSMNQIHKPLLEKVIRSIPVHEVHMLAIMDISLYNTDRNLGNFLISNEALKRLEQDDAAILQKGEMSPIDHANILPKGGFVTPANFAWMSWDQAKRPFDKESIDKIFSLNSIEDKHKIQQLYPQYPRENLEILDKTYYLLKVAVELRLSPFQVGLLFTSEGEVPPLLSEIARMAKEMSPLMGGQYLFVENSALRAALMAISRFEIHSHDDWEARYSQVKGYVRDSLSQLLVHISGY